MKKFDAWFLRWFQIISDRTQKRFGCSNFTIARFLIIVTMICSVSDIVPTSLGSECGFCDVILVGMTTVISLFVLYMLYQLVNSVERTYIDRIDGNNHLEESAHFLRLLVWIFLLYDLAMFNSAHNLYLSQTTEVHYWNGVHYAIGVIESFIFLCFFYFLSCSPQRKEVSADRYSTEIDN